MPSISIRWERRAFKELSRIPKKDRARVVAAVETLKKAPLKGKLLSADWKGLRRLRVGRYRVVYAFDGEVLMISVVRVGHRKEVYGK